MRCSQVAKVGAFVLVLFGVYGIFQFYGFEEHFSPKQLVRFLEDLGPMGPLVFIGLMILAVVVSPIPSLPLDIAGGIAFGPFWGMAYAVTGAEIGAVSSFLIARALGRELLNRLLDTKVVFCEKCSDHHLMVFVFLSRLVPIFSFDIISYGAGLTTMSLKVFALATLFGMIPPTFALTSLGSSVPTLEWPIIVVSGLVLVGVFLWLPKLLLNNRSSWWVRLIQGEPPAQSEAIPLASLDSDAGPRMCPWCGKKETPSQ